MITKGITRKVDLPHEPGAFIEVRQLSWKQLQQARDVRQHQAIKQMGEMGEALKAIREAQSPDARGAEPGPEATYDVTTLLHLAIVGWSYEEPVTPENIDELDEETVTCVVAAVVNGGSEADRKNGSALSMSTSKGAA